MVVQSVATAKQLDVSTVCCQCMSQNCNPRIPHSSNRTIQRVRTYYKWTIYSMYCILNQNPNSRYSSQSENHPMNHCPSNQNGSHVDGKHTDPSTKTKIQSGTQTITANKGLSKKQWKDDKNLESNETTFPSWAQEGRLISNGRFVCLPTGSPSFW